MKIIILIDWFAPAFKAGGPIQSIVNMVENNRGEFEYKIFCSNKDLDGTVLNVVADTWIEYNTFTKVWYSSSDKSILRLVNKESRSWGADALFINHIYSLYYNILPLLFAKAPRKVISVRGALHDGALMQKGFKKRIFLLLWKLLQLHRKNEFHASTQEEKSFVEKAFGAGVKISVAANFPKHVSAPASPSKKQNHLRLISVALISPMKNHLRVLEALADCTSQIEYEIYGPVKDSVYWQKCLDQIKTLPNNVNVSYKGELPPPQVEKVLTTAHVFVLPSESENFGHALYEALISGKPVITSHTTPWNGLEAQIAGRNVSTNKQELTKAIEFFAHMPQNTFLQWSDGANRYAKNKIDFEAIREEYKAMFLQGPQKEKTVAQLSVTA